MSKKEDQMENDTKKNTESKVNEIEIPEITVNKLKERFQMISVLESQIQAICQTILEVKGIKGNYKISDDKTKLIEIQIPQ